MCVFITLPIATGSRPAARSGPSGGSEGPTAWLPKEVERTPATAPANGIASDKLDGFCDAIAAFSTTGVAARTHMRSKRPALLYNRRHPEESLFPTALCRNLHIDFL